ncbi:MAG: GNAT family N-acetyltransferase [Fimbriimonas sp.]
MIIREIAFESPEYWAAVQLRLEVLRKPLGLEFSESELAEEISQWHLGGFEQDEILGCLTLVPLVGGQVKMRQVAVRPEHSNQGIGSALVNYSEEYALSRAAVEMVLHARLTAVRFYQRLGYEVRGEEFEEVGIPHVLMAKKLA